MNINKSLNTDYRLSHTFIIGFANYLETLSSLDGRSDYFSIIETIQLHSWVQTGPLVIAPHQDWEELNVKHKKTVAIINTGVR